MRPSPPPVVLHLGGNGHAPVRLEPVRGVLADLPTEERFEIRDVVYPGFAGRPPARSFDAFLRDVATTTDGVRRAGHVAQVHATGIGAMVVLALRARGHLLGLDTVFLGPVLWGLEERRFPRLMRLPGVASGVASLLRLPSVQRRFARRHFGDDVAPALVEGFFDGYVACRHFADLFRWFTPAFLRELEADLPRRPGALDGITLWWGADDAVVGEREADLTDAALGVSWPRRTFPGWGHYPMLQDPAGWVGEVRRALAPAAVVA